jgi:hypothetical protein
MYPKDGATGVGAPPLVCVVKCDLCFPEPFLAAVPIRVLDRQEHEPTQTRLGPKVRHCRMLLMGAGGVH